MSDTSSEMDSSESGSWVPYASRQEWADVTPIPQDDTETPIVRIAYSKKFVDVFDYFRAIYASNEVSERALALTQDAAELNPANYTVWHHRRFLLKELESDLKQELEYIRGVIEEHPKNYQVWQHRRELVDWQKNPTAELKFTEIILAGDAKNYHAWQHRQWVIRTFNLYSGELEFVERLLEDDVRNNSAWNQRFFVLTGTAPNNQVKGDILQRELDFTFKAIKKVPSNESSWNYLRGLLDRCEPEESDSVREKAFSFCLEMHSGNVRSPYLLGALIDLYTERLEAIPAAEAKEKGKSDLESAKKLCQLLSTEVDVIRKEYWNYIDRDLTARFS